MKPQDLKTWLEQLDRIIDSMALQLRSLSNLLYPSTLESLGLARALSDYVGAYQRRTGKKVEFTGRGLSDRLRFETEATCYRVVCGLLNYIAGETGVERIGVSVHRRSDTLRVNIQVPEEFPGQPSGEARFPGIETIRNFVLIAGGITVVTLPFDQPGRLILFSAVDRIEESGGIGHALLERVL